MLITSPPSSLYLNFSISLSLSPPPPLSNNDVDQNVRYHAHKNTLLLPDVNPLNQSTPSSLTSVRYIVILRFHLRLGLPGFLFLSAFLTKTLLPFVFCPMRATCTAHVIFFVLVTQGTSTVSFEALSDLPLASLFYY